MNRLSLPTFYYFIEMTHLPSKRKDLYYPFLIQVDSSTTSVPDGYWVLPESPQDMQVQVVSSEIEIKDPWLRLRI